MISGYLPVAMFVFYGGYLRNGAFRSFSVVFRSFFVVLLGVLAFSSFFVGLS